MVRAGLYELGQRLSIVADELRAELDESLERRSKSDA